MKELSLSNWYLLYNKGQNCHSFVCFLSFYISFPYFITCNSDFVNCKQVNANHRGHTFICWSAIMGFETADGQNGGPRSVQTSNPPLSPCASAALPGRECQRASPSSPSPRGLSLCGVVRAWHRNLWSIGSTGQRVRLVPCGKSVVYPNLCLLWQRKKKLERGSGRRWG